MLKILLARLRQGHRTTRFPDVEPTLPDRFRGLPSIDPSRCPDGCRECIEACPTDAIATDERGLHLDLGRCLFCPECTAACPEGAIAFGRDHRLAASERADLIVRDPSTGAGQAHPLVEALEAKLLRLFSRSLKLRVVSAGGCNGC